jgi:uncharacterized protein YjbJ (UPF0337 family)
MGWSAIRANWKQYKLAARRRWHKLSEQRLHGTHGSRELLSKRVQEAYSINREEAERQISAWQAKMLVSP